MSKIRLVNISVRVKVTGNFKVNLNVKIKGMDLARTSPAALLER